MGVPFLEHMDGLTLYVCGVCRTNLSNGQECISTRFSGPSGRALLFGKVINVVYDSVQYRNMITGLHGVRDVACKRCAHHLGWMYEFSVPESETYKEGCVALEVAYLGVEAGIQEI